MAGTFYVFMQLFVRGITFLLTPVYSRLVSTAQYGEIRVFESWLLIAVPVMSLCLYRSVARAKFDYPEDFSGYISSAQTLSYISIAGGFLVITLFFRKTFMAFCGLDSLMYVYMILYTFAYTTTYYFQNSEKQLMRYKSSTLYTAVTMIPATLLSVLLLWLGNKTGHEDQLVRLRVVGFYTPQIIGGFIVAALLWRRGGFKVKKEHWRYAALFSLPLIPEVLSIQIMNQADKIMVQKLVDSSSAGIFSLATTVSFIIWIVEDAVWNAWQPWLFEKLARQEIKDIQKPWYTIAFLFSFFSWLLVILAPEIILILGGKRYQAAIYLVAPMVTGTLFRFFSNSFMAVENYQKKTAYCALGTVIAMVCNVALNWIFIQAIGYQAAAYTTTFSFFVLLVVQGLLEKKVCGMRCVSMSRMILISLAVVTVNFATMSTFALAWYLRWLIAAGVSGVILVRMYPDLRQFLTQLKKS